MAAQLPAWMRDKKVWAFAAAGGGLGLLVWLQRRKQAGASPVGADTGQQIVSPASFDDAGIGAYQNLQTEFETLQGQVTRLADAQQAVAPNGLPALVGGQTPPTFTRVSPGTVRLTPAPGYRFFRNKAGQWIYQQVKGG